MLQDLGDTAKKLIFKYYQETNFINYDCGINSVKKIAVFL